MQSNIKVFLLVAAAVAALIAGYANRGFGGFMLVLGAIVFVVLLYVTRVMKILKAASTAPKGRISSAVMINARLKEGMSLLQVVQMTRAISEPQGDPNADEVCHRWTDPGGAWVDAIFVDGKLRQWQLGRAESAEATQSHS